jgi:cytochrome c
MKKVPILLSVVIFLLYACGSNNATEIKKEDAPKPLVDNTSSNPDYAKGLELVAKNDCLTCHKIDEKVTGPAYRDIANKYSEKDTTTLAAKVIKGGTGVWGTIPMTPHPALSQADSKQMVKYILLLKK